MISILCMTMRDLRNQAGAGFLRLQVRNGLPSPRQADGDGERRFLNVCGTGPNRLDAWAACQASRGARSAAWRQIQL